MALAPTTYPHLCSSPRPPSPRATQPLFSPSKHVRVGFSNKCWHVCNGMAKELKPWVLVVKASEGIGKWVILTLLDYFLMRLQ
ncbi:hypothetical protein HRI_001019100 [Hibiscus trionum]|uniref:Uncharacterized protein n=1 Tax=Hibiscus trionum TaxID=183268 RepID=A0A9W7HA43_HIBTR|nr:hypothetical protein HRI_001019100 [Hibiscus trionum]